MVHPRGHAGSAKPAGRTSWRRQPMQGQALVIFALCSLVLIGVLALSVDAGFLMAERRQVQAAADAAALAAARAALDNKSAGEILATGQSYGALNAGVGTNGVAVSRPPATGPYAGNSNYIQVTVTKQVQRFFLGAIYTGPWQVSATATAGVEREGFNAALLALNSTAGGINTSGSTTINVLGGSIVSNYEIRTSGSTTLRADEWVVANDGFRTSGATIIDGGLGENPAAPEVPDPLATVLQPPSLPSAPGNPVPTVNPMNGTCRVFNPWTSPVTWTIPARTYNGGGANCVDINNVPSGNQATFTADSYRFTGGAGISIGGGNSGPIVMSAGGTYNFVGGPGISIGGSTPTFTMQSGSYSFTNGAGITISGSAPGNYIGGGTLYFGGGGGITTGGSNHVTLGPGTYIFDGGSGFSMSGSARLQFTPGTYTFYFLNGADWSFSGSSYIQTQSGVYVRAYFYGSGNNPSNLQMSGSTNFSIPTGEYYFDNGRFLNSGSSLISGSNVFLYFRNGGYLSSTGSASFGFTAPTSTIYPGYYPGVFLYSDRANTASFQWNGSTSSVSRGTIYLPSSPVTMGGASNGKTFEGQFIADRFILGGSNNTTVQFVEYVQTSVPKVFLVE